MIVLTVEKALNLVPVLKNLMQTKLPIKTAYKVARFARLADEQLKDFNEQRVKLVKEYIGEDQKIPTEKMEEFMGKLSALLPIELSIDAEKPSIDELEGVSLTPQEFSVLEQNDFLSVN